MMKQMHGLCSSCANSFNISRRVEGREDSCSKCTKKPPELIFNGDGVCATCYQAETLSPSKVDSKTLFKRSSSIVTDSPFREVEKADIKKSIFGGTSNQVIEKVQKLFEDYPSVPELVAHLKKKALVDGEIKWDKLVSTINKKSPIVYLFIQQHYIFGGFHEEPLNYKSKQEVECRQSGIFLTERQKFNLKFYRVKTNTTDYSIEHILTFGKPSSLTISFNEGVRASTQLLPQFNQLKWLYFLVFKP